MKKYIFLLACLVGFSFCTDHKDLYNPDINPDSESDDNPLGIVVPDGFDWSMMITVNVTVAVDDKYNGQYYYVVEVFNENPAVASSANLLAKGVAKQGETFSAKVNVASALENLYVRKTTPTGRVEIRTFTIQNGNAYCDFTSTVSERSLSSRSAIARGFVDMVAPDANDHKLFPTAENIPANLSKFISEGDSEEGQSYIVASNTSKIDLGQKKNITLYVVEDIELSERFYLSSGSQLFILPGKTLKIPSSTNNGQENCIITIGKGASFMSSGGIQIDSNYKFYNLGSITASSFTCTNSSFLYNAGSIVVAGEFMGTNGPTNILNEGTLSVANLTTNGDSHFENRGTVEVSQMTFIDSNNSSWYNAEGSYTTRNMKIIAGNKFVRNGCNLYVAELLDVSGAGNFEMDGGSYAECQSFVMTNSRISMGGGAYLNILDKASFGWNPQNNNYGIYGLGTSKSLITFNSFNCTDATHFGGNLMIDNGQEPEQNQWSLNWDKSVSWGNDVQIAKTECNPGYGNEPETPTNPELPLEVMTSETCIYAMEDQWPSYGDYDMNDVVVRIKKSIATADNYVKHATFEVWIEAVGADKTIGAALQLDGVTIEMLGTSANGEVVIKHDAIDAISGFSLANPVTNCGENGHKNVVLPLFASANKLMGGNFVNVGKGKNEAPKKVQVDIYFKQGAVKPEALSYDKVNFFITTDGVGNGRTEIHLAGYKPTVLANSSLFGTGKDNPNSPYYSLDRMPWGIMIPVASWECPDERINIMTKYSGFAGWVTSGGQNNKDWYMYPVSPK